MSPAPSSSQPSSAHLLPVPRPGRRPRGAGALPGGGRRPLLIPGEAGRVHSDASATIAIASSYVSQTPLIYAAPEEFIIVESDTTTTTTTTSTYAGPITAVDEYIWGFRYAIIESAYASPFISYSNQYDIGEVHIINKDYKQQRLNNLRYSGPFIGRTQINRLNRFTYNDVMEMEDKHGIIYGLEEVGDTLKVLQTSMNTSVYLGLEYYTDSGGNTQLVTTNAVLGSKRPHEEDYGTIFSRGFVKVDRSLFYYDIYSGKIIRDDPNGQKIISLLLDQQGNPYGIDSEIRAKSRALLDSGVSNVDVIVGSDEKNGVVYFTFLDSNTPANNETMAYHVWDGRWVGNSSFVPELYSNMGDNMFISFKSGEFWKHNSDSVLRNNFYGVQYSSEIHIVSNINAKDEKSWDAIEVASNKLWTIADNDSLVIDPSARYPGGMQSKILAADWEQYEEGFRAAFNFDMLSGDNATANAYYLYNGRELRGRNMLIKLKNSDTSEVNLILVKVYSKVSR